MCMYLRAKLEVSYRVLDRGGGGNFSPHPTSKRTPKKPIQIRSKWPNFTVRLSLPLEICVLGNMWIAAISFHVDDVINFEINFGLFINPFFYLIKKVRKNYNTEEQKELLGWNRKHFLYFLEDFPLP